MTNPIIESGMCFGPYLDEDLFKIETSSQYTTNLLSNGIKSCEFIVKKNGDICFVEAKTSNPKEIEEESPEEKKKKYEAYISDIATKMQDSLDLYLSILLGKYNPDGVGSNLRYKNLAERDIRFILVIKNAEKGWLPPLQDRLRSEMKRYRLIWKAELYVLNAEMACQKGFVQPLSQSNPA